MNNGSIGIFDSGLGGLSVLAELWQMLPNESFYYYGDSLNAPYGIKTKEEVYNLSKHICDTLIKEGCKAIVIACNTATSAAVTRLRHEYDIPIIGMEPAVKPALNRTEGKVLVLATEMTLKEDKFNTLVKMISGEDRIIRWPSPDLVTMVEEAFDQPERVREVVRACLSGVKNKPEAVVLGCTHFIFLKDEIQRYFGEDVPIIDGNEGTAKQLIHLLKANGLCSEHETKGCVTLFNSKGESSIEKSWQMLTYLTRGAINHEK